MSRKARKVFIIATTKGDMLLLSNTRGGRIVGEMRGPGSAVDSRYPILMKETPIYVLCGLDDRGKLVDPVYIGAHAEMKKLSEGEVLEKMASAEDPLTVATVKWKSSGHKPAHLQPVLTELRKVVGGRAQDFGSRGTEVPQAEFMRAGLKALKRYDPNRGVRASTFVVSSLREAHRPLLQRASPVRVPEQRLQQVGRVRAATARLRDELGREPTLAEIAKGAHTTSRDVSLLQREVQPVHMGSKEMVQHGERPSSVKQNWALLRPELKGMERNVYDYLNKRPEAKNTTIAKDLKISSSQVSRYRQRIRRRVMHGGSAR